MFSSNPFDKTLVQKVVLGLRHVGMWVTSKTDVYVNPKFNGSTRGIAIYCVHGTADRPASFSLVGSRLLETLPDEISKIHLVGFNGRGTGKSIKYFAEQLRDQIISNGDNHVILMGHSRGGLVIAYFAEYLANAAGIQVDLAFPVSAPFNGSIAAMWPLSALSSSVQEMQPNSDFLNELSQKMDQSSVRYVHFASTMDPLVYKDSAFRHQHQRVTVLFDKEGDITYYQPREMSVNPNLNPPKLILFDFHNHLSVMSSHRMVKYMSEEINDMVRALALRDAQTARAEMSV